MQIFWSVGLRSDVARLRLDQTITKFFYSVGLPKDSGGVRKTFFGVRRTPKDSEGLRRTLTKSANKIHSPTDEWLSPTFLASPIKSDGLRSDVRRVRSESVGRFWSPTKKKSRRKLSDFRRTPTDFRRTPNESVGLRKTFFGLRSESVGLKVRRDTCHFNTQIWLHRMHMTSLTCKILQPHVFCKEKLNA